jgi:hypothetical protein
MAQRSEKAAAWQPGDGSFVVLTTSVEAAMAGRPGDAASEARTMARTGSALRYAGRRRMTLLILR